MYMYIYRSSIVVRYYSYTVSRLHYAIQVHTNIYNSITSAQLNYLYRACIISDKRISKNEMHNI